MPPARTTVLPLAHKPGGAGRTMALLEVRGLELHPSVCKKILDAPDQIFCPSNL